MGCEVSVTQHKAVCCFDGGYQIIVAAFQCAVLIRVGVEEIRHSYITHTISVDWQGAIKNLQLHFICKSRV